MMTTEIIEIDLQNIETDRIQKAAAVINSGGLVAFPTETVYGLGANALDEVSVENIFKAKGRPSDNPLIVHIADIRDVDKLAREIPSYAGRIMESFWPGPLTLVLKKSPAIPPVITAGLDTVALRFPSHPVAQALIRASGLPIAAPSANVSGKPSPTEAKHVIKDLSGKIDMILDAGRVDIGLESTVLDLTSSPPAILRPGGVTAEELRAVLRQMGLDLAVPKNSSDMSVPKAPGMKYTHYSPNAEVVIIQGTLEEVVKEINRRVTDLSSQGKKAGVLATDETASFYRNAVVIASGSRSTPQTIASSLFRVLRAFDEEKVDIIYAEAVDDSGIGLAIMNRLSKAAGNHIIRV